MTDINIRLLHLLYIHDMNIRLLRLLYIHRDCSIRDGEPRMFTSTFTQLLSSE